MKLQQFIDRFTFVRIFLIWLSIILLFGAIYTFIPPETGGLIQTRTGLAANDFFFFFYFSFITATTTGFGDITPVGLARFIAIIEVVLGLLLLAVVTSKLVSLKQNTIIEELFAITLTERVNRVRSRLLYTRQNMMLFIHRIEEGNIAKRDVTLLYQYFQQLKDAADEMTVLLSRTKKKTLGKVDDVHAGLLAKSIVDTMQRSYELLTALVDQNLTWESDKNKQYVIRTIAKCTDVFELLHKGSYLSPSTFEELEKEKQKIEEQLTALL